MAGRRGRKHKRHAQVERGKSSSNAGRAELGPVPEEFAKTQKRHSGKGRQGRRKANQGLETTINNNCWD